MQIKSFFVTFAPENIGFRSSVGLEQQPSKLWVLGSNPNGITLKRKMKQSTFFILLLLCLSACKPEQEQTNIPDAPIYFQIRLDAYPALINGIGYILQCPDDLKFHEIGNFGYSGTVLLINDFEYRICAYDACCTNPACVAKKNKVSAEIRATCPNCGSVFDLSVGGAVVSGVAKYPLRRYRVSISGNAQTGRILTVNRYVY